MSHRRDTKRAADGGYPGPSGHESHVHAAPTVDALAETRLAAAATFAQLQNVRSLLRTWQQFGGGGEDNMITELSEVLGDKTR